VLHLRILGLAFVPLAGGANQISFSCVFSSCVVRWAHGARGPAVTSCPSFPCPRHVPLRRGSLCCDLVSMYLGRNIYWVTHVVDVYGTLWMFDALLCALITCGLPCNFACWSENYWGGKWCCMILAPVQSVALFSKGLGLGLGFVWFAFRGCCSRGASA